MRTAIFLVFIALIYIGDSIIIASTNVPEPAPDIVIKFLSFVFFAFMVMDAIDFFDRKTK